jgi:hypothetical protein
MITLIRQDKFSLNIRCNETTQKAAVSNPDEVIDFFSIYLIVPATLGPEASASN